MPAWLSLHGDKPAIVRHPTSNGVRKMNKGNAEMKTNKNRGQTATRDTIVGVFEDRAHAQDAIQDLKAHGFTDPQIGLVAHDRKAPGHDVEEAEGSKAGEGAAIGLATGAGIGALWGIGIAAGMLPAIGPVIAGGVLASTLASAATGAAVAGLVGALVGLGIPEEEAEFYETEFKTGRTLVTVRHEGRFDEAWTILQRHGAYDLQTKDTYRNTDVYRQKMATVSRPASTAHAATTRGTTAHTEACSTEAGGKVRLHEEQLHAKKQEHEAGEVRLKKEVVTEHKTIEVPVTREEVVIERRPATGGRATSGDLHPGEQIRVPVREEEVRVEKTVVPKEEVSVSKRKTQHTERVEGDVRREELRVEKQGNVDVTRETKR
jgi:uncharacterized protein (TIGR02271 family)